MTLIEIGILGAAPGAIAGAIYAWFFTFGTVMPWLQVADQWENLIGFLLYFFVFAGLGSALGAVVAMAATIALVFLAILIGSLVKAAYDSAREAFRKPAE